MKVALIFTTNNDTELVVKEYATTREMKNGQHWKQLQRTRLQYYVEESNFRDFVLWKNSQRLDTVEISSDVKRVWVFQDSDEYEIESE